MSIHWNALLGFLISLFSLGNVIVYSLCIMRSRNWRQVVWIGIAGGSLILSASGFLYGFIPTEVISFVVRPGIFLLVSGIFAFGLWELARGRRDK